MRRLFFRKKVKALTLTELLVVMVIIGILILLALPNLMPQVSNARAQEAKLNLEHIYTLQKTYFMEHAKYGDDLTQIGFESDKLVSDGGSAHYMFEVEESSNNSFVVKATAVTDFDQDGNFNVWQIDQEKNLTELTKD